MIPEEAALTPDQSTQYRAAVSIAALGLAAPVLLVTAVEAVVDMAGRIGASIAETGRMNSSDSGAVALGGVGVLLALAVPFVVFFLALRQSFRGRSRHQRLANIVASYGALILTFTGIYYACAFWGDYFDSMGRYMYYRRMGEALHKQELQEARRRRPDLQIPPPPDLRAFRGMTARMWTTLDTPPSITLGPFLIMVTGTGPGPISQQEAFKRATEPASKWIQFNPTARRPTLLDAFHLSVVTQATVGFGDITPTAPYSKLAADTQIVMGIVVLVVALALLAWDEPAPRPS